MKNKELLLSIFIYVLLGVNLSDAFSSKKFVKPTVQRIEHSVAKKIEHSDNAAIEGARRLAESITPAGFILRAVGLFPLDVIPISPPAMKAIKLVNDLKDLHKEDFAALQQCRSQAHNDTVVIRKIEKSVIRDSLPKLLKQAAAALNSPMGQLIDKLFGMYVYLSDLTAGLDEIIMYACGGAGGVKDDRKRLPESVSNFFVRPLSWPRTSFSYKMMTPNLLHHSTYSARLVMFIEYGEEPLN